MSLIKAIKAQLGLSVTPANNFALDASADNGTMKLARNSGQDILTVDASGRVGFPQSAIGFEGSSTAVIPNNTVTLINNYTLTQNRGNAFNPATGIFTAPVAGWYNFSTWLSCGMHAATRVTSIITYAAPTGSFFTVVTNDNFPPTAKGYAACSTSIIMFLTAGQRAQMGAYISWADGQPHPTDDGALVFRGALVMPA
jgi:hypothetical protein